MHFVEYNGNGYPSTGHWTKKFLQSKPIFFIWLTELHHKRASKRDMTRFSYLNAFLIELNNAKDWNDCWRWCFLPEDEFKEGTHDSCELFQSKYGWRVCMHSMWSPLFRWMYLKWMMRTFGHALIKKEKKHMFSSPRCIVHNKSFYFISLPSMYIQSLQINEKINRKPCVLRVMMH